MAFEVEIKAHIRDPQRLQNLLEERYGRGADFQKRDLYFASTEQSEPREQGSERLAFRLRFERRADEEFSLVTAKKKSMRSGVEINEEFEFSVSDTEAFCAFAAALGYGVALEKNKIGQAWTPEPHVTIELAEVAGLGHFIEIENMADESGAIAGARARVSELLASLGVGEQDIEPRYYTDMLEEQDKK